MTNDDDLRVQLRADGRHDFVDGVGAVIAEGFATISAAWAWIDRNTDCGRDEADRARRIRTSRRFS